MCSLDTHFLLHTFNLFCLWHDSVTPADKQGDVLILRPRFPSEATKNKTLPYLLLSVGVEPHSQAGVTRCKLPNLYRNTTSGKLLYEVMPVLLFPSACGRGGFATGVTQG